MWRSWGIISKFVAIAQLSLLIFFYAYLVSPGQTCDSDDDICKQDVADDEEWTEVNADIVDGEVETFYFTYKIVLDGDIYKLVVKSLNAQSCQELCLCEYATEPCQKTILELESQSFDYVVSASDLMLQEVSLRLVVMSVDVRAQLLICAIEFVHLAQEYSSLPADEMNSSAGLSLSQKAVIRRLANASSKNFMGALNRIYRVGARSLNLSTDALIMILLGIRDYTNGVDV